ncbi:MAG: radical SAM family heme chaperone HemW [Gammaproteobacteria bacterium]|nr:radical SAM family heme chaperone HemW [Gammaproteobacteria bacterium]
MSTAAAPDTAPAALRPRFPARPPLSLYVHLPWCVRKCPYCDFNSYEARGRLPDDAYVDALLRDLDAESAFAAERAVSSIFIGGGTPSLFSGHAITLLIDGIRSRLPVAADAEITLEANPGAVEAERFADFVEAGVNRLSIGVQSFRDSQLGALGRVHDSAEAVRAVELARRAGFTNVNVDLMYGLPGDDAAGALRDVELAAELAPTHISWYQLTLEPNTAFHRRPPSLPRDETIKEIEERGLESLRQHGYLRYEISAHAREGFRCRHNLHYWRFGDYIGIGAGAHGKLTCPERGAILRRAKTRNPATYMERAGTPAAVGEERVESPEQIVLEFMMNALRLTDGVDVDCFERRTGQPRSVIAAAIADGVRRGWLHDCATVLKPTPRGLDVLNSVLLLF